MSNYAPVLLTNAKELIGGSSEEKPSFSYKYYAMILIIVYIVLVLLLLILWNEPWIGIISCGIDLSDRKFKCKKYEDIKFKTVKVSIYYIKILMILFNISFINEFLTGNIFQYVTAILFPSIFTSITLFI